MPEAMADDVFVKHSMTQNSENSNTDMQKEDGNQATYGDNGKNPPPAMQEPSSSNSIPRPAKNSNGNFGPNTFGAAESKATSMPVNTLD